MPKPAPTSKPKKIDEDTPVASDPEIERVADALALPKEEEAPVVDAEPEPVEPEPVAPPIPTRKAKPKGSFSHVVTEWCGELHHEGTKYMAGQGINLSPAEAKALGKNVEPA